MVRWRLGTMGFGYPQWADVFYPKGMKAGEYLPHYASQFDAVELDTTFYGTPATERVRRWGDATPEGFCFCAKAPRAVTHDRSIDQGVGEMLAFLDAMSAMGPKLGAVLLQFPPQFSVRELARLDRFLSEMPGDVDLAAEFRHDSWRGDEVRQMLAKHRVAWAWSDYLDQKHAAPPTADFLYVRWVGVHRRYPQMNVELADTTDRLAWWREQVERAAAGGAVSTVFGFFNNDYAGYSVATCIRLKRMVGMEVRSREIGGLFGSCE